MCVCIFSCNKNDNIKCLAQEIVLSGEIAASEREGLTMHISECNVCVKCQVCEVCGCIYVGSINEF